MSTCLPEPRFEPAVLIARAVQGDQAASRVLVRELTPTIERAVGAIVSRSPYGRSGDAHQETRDLTQEVLLMLFRERGRVLRRWNPQRGVPLSRYAAMIARRRTIAHLRACSSRRLLALPSDVAGNSLSVDRAPSPEQRAVERQELVRVLERLRAELPARRWRLFYRLFVRGDEVEEVSGASGLTANAVYTLRTHLRRIVRELKVRLELM
jgi:RNA polymerase sigma factor (sigma-70 family)